MREFCKGAVFERLLPEALGHAEGGWGYNPHYATNSWYVTWPNRRMTRRFRNRIGRLAEDEIIVHPVFKPFGEDWLFTTNAISLEAVEPIRARLLADGIPATSFAAGANLLADDMVVGNIDYAACRSGQWPRSRGRWLHSDIKNVAFVFNHLFFKKLVNEENQ